MFDCICNIQECINITDDDMGWKTLEANKARFVLTPPSPWAFTSRGQWGQGAVSLIVTAESL